MKRVPVLLLVLAVAALPGLVACGGGGEPAQTGSSAQPTAAVPGSEEVEAGSGGGVEACDLVTRQDASALFGQPASPDSGPSVPSMVGQCLWTWDTETSNQLLQFFIWTRLAYDPPDDSEPFDLGEEGYLRAHPLGGVDIAWVEGDRMMSLAYSTIGPDAPKATSKVEEMKALARKVAGQPGGAR